MSFEMSLSGADSSPFARSCSNEVRSAASYEEELADHRATEAQLRKALAQDEVRLRQKDELIGRQDLLSKESDHRLLNDLQIVVSLLSLQSRTEVNAEIASQLACAAGRVATIARVHRRLHSMDGVRAVAFRQYLIDLCNDFSTMLASPERSARSIVVEGVETRLPTVVGIPLACIANELITNAVKHGKGRISVRLEPAPAGGCVLSVSSEGSRLPEDFDPRACKGLGMSIILALVTQVGGELRFDRGDNGDGARFTVQFG